MKPTDHIQEEEQRCWTPPLPLPKLHFLPCDRCHQHSNNPTPWASFLLLIITLINFLQRTPCYSVSFSDWVEPAIHFESKAAEMRGMLNFRGILLFIAPTDPAPVGYSQADGFGFMCFYVLRFLNICLYLDQVFNSGQHEWCGLWCFMLVQSQAVFIILSDLCFCLLLLCLLIKFWWL